MALPPIPYQSPVIDPKTGKVTGEWLRWLNAVKAALEALA